MKNHYFLILNLTFKIPISCICFFTLHIVVLSTPVNLNILMENLKPLKQWSFNDFKIIQASWGFLNKTIIIASAEGELGLLCVEDCK